MSAIEARDWLTQIDGIGKKTASVLLLFCFGSPLLPIDRHVDRVMRRVGVLPPKPSLEEAHDLVLGLFEPDQMYEAHVNLIQHGRKVCHAQRPDHDGVPADHALPLRRPEGALTDASRNHEGRAPKPGLVSSRRVVIEVEGRLPWVGGAGPSRALG